MLRNIRACFTHLGDQEVREQLLYNVTIFTAKIHIPFSLTAYKADWTDKTRQNVLVLYNKSIHR